MHIKVAVVQFEIQQFQPDENLRKAEKFIAEAATRADIIVFPEDFVTGPVFGNKTFVDVEGRYVRHFQRLAATYAIDIVPGSIIEKQQDSLYNTTYYIDKTGAIKGCYRKVNLWLSERSYMTPGNEFVVFETAYGRVGLLICWDLIFPEAFRALVRQHVDIVICPSYWCFEDAGVGLRYDLNAEIKLVDALCTGRAFENGIALVYANAASSPVRRRQADGLIGHSQITVPFQGVLQMLPHAWEKMFIQAIDMDLLKDAELAYEIRNDLRTRLLC